MKTIIIALSFLLWPLYSYSGVCNYPKDIDSAGRQCGARAASIKLNGRLGGDGKYKASQKNKRQTEEQINRSPQNIQYKASQKNKRQTEEQISRSPQSIQGPVNIIQKSKVNVIRTINTCGFGYPAFDKHGNPNCRK